MKYSNVRLLSLILVAACSGDPVPAPEPRIEPSTMTSAAPENTVIAPPAMSAAADAGSDVQVDAPLARLPLDVSVLAATFKNGKASGGSFRGDPFYKFDFTVKNASNEVLKSFDQLKFDFGPDKKVTVDGSLCRLDVNLQPNQSLSFQATLLVNASKINSFDVVCRSVQRFPGATGSAPASATFAGPIKITVGGAGTTAETRFEAVGDATRIPE
jgi:hypothetical protein